jgi:hypothetical protein
MREVDGVVTCSALCRLSAGEEGSWDRIVADADEVGVGVVSLA